MMRRPRRGTETQTGGPRAGRTRRGAMRFPIEQPVCYKVISRHSMATGHGKTLNMSSAGVLFTTESPLAPGERVELAVHWPAQLDHKHPLKLVARGRVVRVADSAAAIVVENHEFRTQGANGLNWR
ncbi:MAG: hypothetical protein FJW34_09555 [Acidobacteria bacterium]|nr:hypothetical protein [Acidobacteriota bacterium]